MNRLNDTDLREALRRREARRQQPEVPADFMGRVMQDIQPKRHSRRVPLRRARRIAFAALVAAASIALVVLLTWPHQANPNFTPSKPPLYSEESPTLVGVKSEPAKAPAKRARASTPSKRRLDARELRSSKGTSPGGDDDDLMAELERGLADVGDSCYLAQVERMIADNPELQQLMNEMTNQRQ